MTRDLLPKYPSSFWNDTANVNKYPKLDKDLNVDIGVIGGGIGGILSAYELAKTGKKVALFESRRLIYGTTGYTTSKLSAQHDIIYDELIKRYGTEKARKYYDANMKGIEIIKNMAEKHNINCELIEQDAYAYTIKESRIEDMRKEATAYENLSINGAYVDKLPVDLDIEAGVVMHNQYEFHPVMFLSGVLNELEKMKVLIFENTMITEVEDGEEVKLKTKEGNTVKCKKAICASHYPVDDPEKFYAENTEPSMSLATIYEYDKEYPGGMYISYDDPLRTFRLVTVKGKKYILVGGEGHTLGTETSELARYKSIVKFAKEAFGVEDVVAYWSSHDYMTKDRLPFIGLSGPDRENVFVITGLNKWGLSAAAIGARLLKDIIEEKENPYQELFNPHREIPDIEESEEESEESNKENFESKENIEDLEKEEALTYEKDDKKFGVFKDSDGKLHYLDLTCTHLGCDLGWNDGDRTWDCPCHGSRFDATGDVIEGPAMEPLKILEKEELE